MISKNAGQNAKRVVEAVSATEFQRQKKKSLKEETFIAGFMELEFSLSSTSTEKQIDHSRLGGNSYRSKVT